MTKREALAKYAASMSRAKRGDFYVSIVRRWLESDGRVSPAAIGEYAQSLEARGYKPSSIQVYLEAIRQFCRVNGLPYGCTWQRRKDFTPRRIAVSEEVVAQLIKASFAWTKIITARDRAWLLLSTLYGCRACELAAWHRGLLRPPDAVLIRRAKRSISRWYWLHPALAPYLASLPQARVLENHPYISLRRLWAAADLGPLPKGTGWHAIRRSLVVALRTRGLSDELVQRFIGWRPRTGTTSSTTMPRLYGSPTLWVTATGLSKAVVPPIDLHKADQEAWDKHPFLHLWLNGAENIRRA